MSDQTAFEHLLDDLRDRGSVVTDSGHGKAQAQCPSHDDGTASLSVAQRSDGNGAVVHCHAGCSYLDILAALGMTAGDLFDAPSAREVWSPRRDYRYPGGRVVHRKPGKVFPQSGDKTDRSLYHADRIGDATTVYVPEGEKDCEAIELVGGTAVCAPMGAGKAHLFDWEPLRGKHVRIVADKDEPGRKHTAQVAELLDGIAASVTIVEAKTGKDAADHIAAGHGLEEFVPATTVTMTVVDDAELLNEPKSLLSNMFTAAALDKMEFDPLVEHVPALVTEGMGILAGPPKAGKSWMTGGIALGCAQGGVVLGGIRVQKRAVLLLALEDGQRRLQSRMRHLNHGQPLPPNLDIITGVQPGTVIATITAWLALHATDGNPPLVILDTLGKARPQRRAGDDPYIADYQLGSRIKATIDAVPGAAILCVHHTRKMAAEDFVDTLSGTQGIAGSADYILVLSRKRKSDEGVLAVTGRDIEENEYAVKTDRGIWTLDGMDITDAAATVAARREQSAQAKLGGRSLDAMKFVNSRESTTPAELAEHLGIDGNSAGKVLQRLADDGYIDKPERGTYVPASVGSVGSVVNPGQTVSPPANTTLTTDTTDTCACGTRLVLDESIKSGQCMECYYAGGQP